MLSGLVKLLKVPISVFQKCQKQDFLAILVGQMLRKINFLAPKMVKMSIFDISESTSKLKNGKNGQARPMMAKNVPKMTKNYQMMPEMAIFGQKLP